MKTTKFANLQPINCNNVPIKYTYFILYKYYDVLSDLITVHTKTESK